MREAPVGPTRHDKQIDRIFTNFGSSKTESGTLAPLESEDSTKSNHRISYCQAELARLKAFEWQTYTVPTGISTRHP